MLCGRRTAGTEAVPNGVLSLVRKFDESRFLESSMLRINNTATEPKVADEHFIITKSLKPGSTRDQFALNTRVQHWLGKPNKLSYEKELAAEYRRYLESHKVGGKPNANTKNKHFADVRRRVEGNSMNGVSFVAGTNHIIGSLARLGWKYDALHQDEAGQATDPSLMVALEGQKPCLVMICGDPKKLSSTVTSGFSSLDPFDNIQMNNIWLLMVGREQTGLLRRRRSLGARGVCIFYGEPSRC